MKKLLAILTCVLLLCASIPLGAIPVSAATSGTTGDCTWTLDGTHLTISGNGEMEDYNPWSNQYAPWGTSISSVTIEEGVTAIGEYAFYNCSSLVSATTPTTLAMIGNYAFDQCSSLSSDFHLDNVISVGSGAFSNCSSITTITLGDKLIAIGGDAFYCCSSLSAITLPNSLTIIGIGAFMDCSQLTTITIPDSVTYIGEFAFNSCTALTSLTIGSGLSTVVWGAFDGCRNLTEVTLSNSVTSVEEGAFYGCDSLTDIYYIGSETDRDGISIGDSNTPLLDATWHYLASTIIYGDVNGDGKVNNQDLGLLQQYLNEWEVSIDTVAANMDGNGKINNMDLGLLQRYLNGWDIPLPSLTTVELPRGNLDIDGKGRIFVESVTREGGTISVTFVNRGNKWITDETAYLKYICTDADGNTLTTDHRYYGYLYFGMLDLGGSHTMTFTLPVGTARVEFGDYRIAYWTAWS